MESFWHFLPPPSANYMVERGGVAVKVLLDSCERFSGGVLALFS